MRGLNGMRNFFAHHTTSIAYLTGISTTAWGTVTNGVQAVQNASTFDLYGTLSDIAVVVGIACTAGTFGVNFVFKRREDKRKQEEHMFNMLHKRYGVDDYGDDF